MNVPSARPARQGPPARSGLPPDFFHNLLGTPAPARGLLEEWRSRLGLPRTVTLLPSCSSLLPTFLLHPLLPPLSLISSIIPPPSSSSLSSSSSHIPPPSSLLRPLSCLFPPPLSCLLPPPSPGMFP